MSRQGILGTIIGVLGLLTIAAVADVHQWQLPVGFYNAGIREFGVDQTGSVTALGKVSYGGKASIDGGAVIHGGLTVANGTTTDTLTATGAGTDVTLVGGAMAFASDPVIANSQYSGVLAVNIGLTEKWGTSALLDGGKLVTFTSAFTYQDGGPPLCVCSTLGAGPIALSCDAVAAGTGVTASGTVNSVAGFAYHCVGPQ